MLQGEHSAILSTFIKLLVVIKTFAMSIFEWLFYTGITVKVQPLDIVEHALLHGQTRPLRQEVWKFFPNYEFCHYVLYYFFPL